MIFNFYMFDRKGTCLYFQEWKRLQRSSKHSLDENAKLMFGMLYSLKDFVKRISPTPPYEGFRHYVTGSYKLHYLETLSGLKIVLTTDIHVGDIQQDIKDIHKIYVAAAVKNPCYEPGQEIRLEVFKEKIDSYVRSLPYFR